MQSCFIVATPPRQILSSVSIRSTAKLARDGGGAVIPKDRKHALGGFPAYWLSTVRAGSDSGVVIIYHQPLTAELRSPGISKTIRWQGIYPMRRPARRIERLSCRVAERTCLPAAAYRRPY